MTTATTTAQADQQKTTDMIKSDGESGSSGQQMEKLIDLQVTSSTSAATTTTSSSKVKEDEEKKSNSSDDDAYNDDDNMKYQQHIKHQQVVFDELSDVFFANPNKEIPTDELRQVYKDMTYDIMFQILLHTQQKTSSSMNETTTPDRASSDTELIKNKKKNPNHVVIKRQYHLLDVGCGTGILWEFLIDAFQEIIVGSNTTQRMMVQEDDEEAKVVTEEEEEEKEECHESAVAVEDVEEELETTVVPTAPPKPTPVTYCYELIITGIDVSTKMIYHAQRRAHQIMMSSCLSQIRERGKSGGQQKKKMYTYTSGNIVIIKPIIHVIQMDVIDYCKTVYDGPIDGVFMNACYGNFYNPKAVLDAIPTTTIATTKPVDSAAAASAHDGGHDDTTKTTEPTTTTTTKATIICISHPLGNSFVHQLHERDPETVPHVLPECPHGDVHSKGKKDGDKGDIKEEEEEDSIDGIVTMKDRTATISSSTISSYESTYEFLSLTEEPYYLLTLSKTKKERKEERHHKQSPQIPSSPLESLKKKAMTLLEPVHVGYHDLKEWQSNKNEQIKSQILSSLKFM